jgi:hypothetical protein
VAVAAAPVVVVELLTVALVAAVFVAVFVEGGFLTIPQDL